MLLITKLSFHERIVLKFNLNLFSYLLIYLVIFLYIPKAFSFQTRGELNRFTLLHDRVLILKSLKQPLDQEFINIDLFVSSRFKDFVLNLNNGAGNGASGTLAILSKDINTEYFIDANLKIAGPLPKFKLINYNFYPSLFLKSNLGASLSDSNKNSFTNPEVQLYVRNQLKYGFSFLIRGNQKNIENDYFIQASLYQIKRADSVSSLDTVAIESSGELIDSSSISTFHTYFGLDLSLTKYYFDTTHLFEIKELQLYSKSLLHSKYGTLPLVHYRFENYWNSIKSLSTIIGVHARIRYNINKGIYAGIKFEDKKKYPVKVFVLINDEFLTISPALSLKYFYFNYTLIMPYSNPQNNLWVGSIHNINISVPFP